MYFICGAAGCGLLADNRHGNHGRIDSGRQNLKQNMQKIFRKQWVRSAKPFRMALGALIIQEKLGVTDRETVELS